MLKENDRILTTHTGSLPRPAHIENLLVAIDRDATVRSNNKDLPRLLDQAVRDIVERQRAVGIDIVCDGETSKFGYSTYVRERLTGLDGPGAVGTGRPRRLPGFCKHDQAGNHDGLVRRPRDIPWCRSCRDRYPAPQARAGRYGSRHRVHDRSIAGDYFAVPRQQSLFRSGSLPLRLG